MFRVFCALLLLFGAELFVGHTSARAETPTLLGSLGLNTIPSARMDEAGTARISISRLKPYTHTAAGFQFSDALYISFRQSSHSGEHYPGFDIKLRLLQENRYRPEIALGHWIILCATPMD